MPLISWEEHRDLKRKNIKEWNIPIIPKIGFRESYDYTSLPEIDYITYDVRSMTYKTHSQEKRIRELESRINKKSSEESNKLQEIIAYYFNR